MLKGKKKELCNAYYFWNSLMMAESNWKSLAAWVPERMIILLRFNGRKLRCTKGHFEGTSKSRWALNDVNWSEWLLIIGSYPASDEVGRWGGSFGMGQISIWISFWEVWIARKWCNWESGTVDKILFIYLFIYYWKKMWRVWMNHDAVLLKEMRCYTASIPIILTQENDAQVSRI